MSFKSSKKLDEFKNEPFWPTDFDVVVLEEGKEAKRICVGSFELNLTCVSVGSYELQIEIGNYDSVFLKVTDLRTGEILVECSTMRVTDFVISPNLSIRIEPV